MIISTAPLPIPGDVIDPPPRPAPPVIGRLEAREGPLGVVVTVGFRAYSRFSRAQVTLLAAGTTYYLFVGMFSIIAFAYGLTTALGAEQVASYITEAVAEAFPGLLGEGGIDPEQMRAVGQTTSIIGGVGLLYAGTGAVVAASRSIHVIFGAAKDPRNVVLARLRSLGWLFVLLPLVLLSYVASTFTANVADRLLEVLGVSWQGPGVLLNVGSGALTLVVNFLVIYLMLGNLGGIRPHRLARLVGAGVGGFAIEVLKTLMALLVGYTIDKPQYGALAVPIGVLFVLYLQSLAVYAAACLTAGIADKDVPLDVLLAAGTESAQEAVEAAARSEPGDTDGLRAPPGE
ncbi:YihY/virulence factor BrkB family protein [Actinotalea sp. M2MS4P-6]|uniref:YihY/virulence factor BrkB family protein n=1 Tax=Actinotalea sp. M2MS4P-6 TaxID=2983762 RepID=UPI0021E45947|nr:YihY/virulence factor BrkB family protein [Actinotalea sp. M2MS4P-6]MCV2395387.1 YihY/virulence factor BrkB family protein [Actinotalea sp. M2MS4P-6]